MFHEIKLWFNPKEVRATGATPDYRFSLANERTFLSWIRTSMALVGGGLAVTQFVDTPTAPGVANIIAIALLVLGGTCALRAVDHWVRCELAIRTGSDLPTSRFPALLAVVLGTGAIGLVVLVAVGLLR